MRKVRMSAHSPVLSIKPSNQTCHDRLPANIPMPAPATWKMQAMPHIDCILRCSIDARYMATLVTSFFGIISFTMCAMMNAIMNNDGFAHWESERMDPTKQNKVYPSIEQACCMLLFQLISGEWRGKLLWKQQQHSTCSLEWRVVCHFE
jgi:hypothetical protein